MAARHNSIVQYTHMHEDTSTNGIEQRQDLPGATNGIGCSRLLELTES